MKTVYCLYFTDMEKVDKKTESMTVSLEPFVHQVGGHSCFQQFEQYTVCKPLFSKELKFYQEMPSVLKPFIPQFKGVVTAQLKEDCQGKPRLIVHQNGNCAEPKDYSDFYDDIHSSWDYGVCCRNNSNPQKYLILENVISRYHHPSILDLKMGTDVHSDYKTSAEEMQRRRSKWEKTTASTLGVRLSGMKVYRVDCGGFLCRSKSYGSRLTDQGFEEELATFFSNGGTFRCELIECFVKKLETFLKVMEKDLSSYRFYNSSLLLVYDGDVREAVLDTPSEDCNRNCSESRSSLAGDCAKQSTCTLLDQIDIRMIDFAHVSHYDISTGNPSCNPGPDNGYIFGLKSLIRILRRIQEHHRNISSKTKSSGRSLESHCSRCNAICHIE